MSRADPVFMNPEDAVGIGVDEGDSVMLRSRRGEVQMQVRPTESCPRGLVFVPFHFSEAKINLLTNPALDPIAKTPELKVCAIAVERA